MKKNINYAILVIAMMIWAQITVNAQPPTIITDFNNHPKETVKDLWNGTIEFVKTIANYYTNPDYATQLNTEIIIWWEDNMNTETITANWEKYKTDPKYARKIENEIITQLTYIAVFHKLSSIPKELGVPKLKFSIPEESRFGLLYAGFEKIPTMKANINGFILRLETGSGKFGMRHIYKGHSPEYMLARFENNTQLLAHSKTMFLESSPEYIAKIFGRWSRYEPELMETVNGLRIYEGKAMTSAGFYRTFCCVVESDGTVKSFYPLMDINPRLLNSEVYGEFLRAQALKKPFLINYEPIILK